MTSSDLFALEKKAAEILMLRRLGASYAEDYHKDVLWLLSEVRRLREALVECSTAECGHCDRGVSTNAHDIATKALA